MDSAKAHIANQKTKLCEILEVYLSCVHQKKMNKTFFLEKKQNQKRKEKKRISLCLFTLMDDIIRKADV
jgi:hypothetical protein